MKYIYILIFVGISQIFANNLVEIVLPNDKWKLIGVSGAFMEGSDSSEIQMSFPWHWGVENNSSDGNYTGLKDGGNTAEYNSSTNLVGFSVINPDYYSVTISFNGDENNIKIDTTLPRRRMYIDTNFDGSADCNVSYQSDLEGETFNLLLTKTNTSSHYYGIFNSSYSEVNPMTLSKLTGTSSTYTLRIRDIIDMNFSNNPGKAGQKGNINDYEKATNRDVLQPNDYLKIFRLDSTKSVWESFYSNTAIASNDFENLTSGSAYWVRLHDDDDDNNTKHGLILGDGNISISTYSAESLSSSLGTSRYGGHSLLHEGWNMLSFPDGQIRHSGTGLILEVNKTEINGSEFNISDEVGKEFVQIHIYELNRTGANNQTIELAQNINLQIMSAIEEGNISQNFNIRAYAQGEKLTLISDKRFRIYDSSDNKVFGAVTTLGGQNPYDLDINSNSYNKTISDLQNTGVASKYGEYSLIATVTNDGEGNVAGTFINHKIGAIRINNENISIVPTNNKVSNISLSEINTKLGLTSQIIDLDLNEKNDSILLVGNSPFYIRDNTFTKVFRADDDFNGTVYLTQNGEDNFTAMLGNTTASLGGNITANSSINATVNGNYLYLATINSNYRNFDLRESGTDDNLTRVISNNATSFGAIKEVYSLINLGRSDVNKSIFKLIIDANSSKEGDDFNFTIDSSFFDCNVTSNDVNAGKICIDCSNIINQTSSVNVFAECNTSNIADINVTLTLTGYFTTATFELNSSKSEGNLTVKGDANISKSECSDFWEQNSTGGVATYKADTELLTDNLQYNPVYAPNFPTANGILKYIRENGFKAKAILTAVDNSSGEISWKYTDLTVGSDMIFNEMFDYSLFNTELENGYFVKLESNGSSTSSDIILTPSLNLDFYQHYNSDSGNVSLSESGNVQNFFKGTLTARVTNDEGENTQVVATIQNRDYQFLQTNSQTYSLEISRENFPEIAMSDSNITLTVYDEVGNTETKQLEFNLSSPAKPVVRFFNGKYMFVGSTSSDVSAFNIYKGKVDDRYPTPIEKSNSTFVKNLTSENDYKTKCDTSPKDWYGNENNEFSSDFNLTINGVDYNYSEKNTSVTIKYPCNSIGNVTKGSVETFNFYTYNICEDSPNFDTNNTGWLITAVDGDGDATNSRVSNITFLDDWFSFYKNASILEVNGSNTTDNKPSLYESNCSLESNATQDNGVVLSDVNFSGRMTIAYDTISTTSIGVNIPHQVYICINKDSDHNCTKIQFAKNIYSSSINTALSSSSPKTLLIRYEYDTNDTTYKTDFDTLTNLTADSEFNITEDMKIGALGQTLRKWD